MPPEENSGLWRYRIRGKDVEGGKLDCVVDIDDTIDPIEGGERLVIVTVF